MILHDRMIELFIVGNVFDLDTALIRPMRFAGIHDLVKLQNDITRVCTLIKE